MTSRRQIFITIILFAMTLGNKVSALELEDAIEARQAFMKVYQFNLEMLEEMAGGDAPFNARHANTAGRNLLALARMNNTAMWPHGSDTANLPLSDKTSAKPEAWTEVKDVAYRHATLAQALERFLRYGTRDQNSLKHHLPSLKNACKGCHERYRSNKN